jgi:EmrB/QacA subfamily drug resistance transporter
MPTAVAELGGVGRYAWAFSAYLLTSTTTVPLFGKLADLYGRRRIYSVSVAIFVVGSALCGAAGSIQQLLLFRALQGVGAGGVVPVAVTVIGDIYTLEERGRMQGLFSGVWALASLLGPLIGGLVTDTLSWRWVFYFNMPFGVLSAVMLWTYLHEEPPRRAHRLDLAGTITLTLSVCGVLWVLQEAGPTWGWGDARTLALALAVLAGLALFTWEERRAPEPMLPLDLFRSRVISVSTAGAVILGLLLFALVAYVPMYAQVVRGDSAAAAGGLLMAMSIGWPISSTVAGALLLRTGYRSLVLTGSVVCAAGCLLLALAGHDPSRTWLLGSMLLAGIGMGFISTPYLVALQAAVPYARRGAATAVQQFFRTMAGAVVVAVMGAVLNGMLAARLHDPAALQSALEPAARAALAPEALLAIRTAFAEAIHVIFIVTAVIAALGVVIAWFFPAGSAATHAHRAD